jgi:hypothetical protein
VDGLQAVSAPMVLQVSIPEGDYLGWGSAYTICSIRSCMSPDLARLGPYHCTKPSAAAMEVQLGWYGQLKRVENRRSQLFIRVKRT